LRRSVLQEPRVNVIIPTLNEAKNIGNIIRRLKRVGCHSILVVDGHSTDGTVERAMRLGAETIIQNGHGKGGALREAFQNSCLDGDVIVMMDADGSMAPEEIPTFVEAIEKGAHVVKGSRFLPSGGSEDLTAVRRIGNIILTGVLNFLFFTRYTDLCYGFMAFRKATLDLLSPHLGSEEFEIETEICIKSSTLGFNVVEVPSVERERVHGISNLHTIKDGFKIMSLVLREAMRAN
jgi:glycosyltransferase involved in cell wall biosynthesis